MIEVSPGEMQQLQSYLQKRALFPPALSLPPEPGLGLIVVIPCREERGLITTLASLWRCHRPPSPVEVLVVVNGSEADDEGVRGLNQETLEEARAWIENHRERGLGFHLLHYPDLPKKHAGVGFARKIGLDEAVVRFHQVGNPQGVMVCLDADCTVSDNYLVSLHDHFHQHALSPGCAIHFEHPLEEISGHEREGIIQYELYLRYYVWGLRFAGFPHAHHSVGSSMAVRAWAYAKQGGMNRRQGGEDFYFLQKIIPLGGFTDLRAGCVYPSPRRSHRVPFGTGRAMSDWRDGVGFWPVNDPRGFLALRDFFQGMEEVFQGREMIDPTWISPTLQDYLDGVDFGGNLKEMQGATSSEGTFRKRFFQWCNAFWIFKWIRFVTEAYGAVPVSEGAATLWQWLEPQEAVISRESIEWLECYRQLDRQGRVF
ncbi:MAG: glycosyltransferase family 2 protein [Magnetococcales bacterium]|nr:glycosyltransferase family 2 protein [Magnetococcales bacterium]